jgi:TatA/E family protein of Tat protein translocase
MPNFGIWEILLLLLVLLLVFGPKRLPGMGRSLGRGMREFKESVTDQTHELKEAMVDTPREFKEAINPLAPTKADGAEESAPVPAAETAPAPVAPAPTPGGDVAPPAEPAAVAAEAPAPSSRPAD